MGVYFFALTGMQVQITTQVFEVLANPLFFESYLDDTQVTDTSLLVSPIIRRKKYHKRVRWLDEDEGQPLVELFTYISNWDRTPIQVSRAIQKRNKKSSELTTQHSCFPFYLCIAFFITLLIIMG